MYSHVLCYFYKISTVHCLSIWWSWYYRYLADHMQYSTHYIIWVVTLIILAHAFVVPFRFLLWQYLSTEARLIFEKYLIIFLDFFNCPFSYIWTVTVGHMNIVFIIIYCILRKKTRKSSSFLFAILDHLTSNNMFSVFEKNNSTIF